MTITSARLLTVRKGVWIPCVECSDYVHEGEEYWRIRGIDRQGHITEITTCTDLDCFDLLDSLEKWRASCDVSRRGNKDCIGSLSPKKCKSCFDRACRIEAEKND